MNLDDDLPADMLLLRERRRRASGSTSARSQVGSAETHESVLLESDALVDDGLRPAASTGRGATALFRPLASVTLAQLSWTGAIDHAALQTAIACSPGHAVEGPALHVVLDDAEIAVIESARRHCDAPPGDALWRAAVLPSTIVGTDASTVGAAGAVLTAYRRASLVYAWRCAIGGDQGADETSRRDEAAAQLMSLLRALLGEA